MTTKLKTLHFCLLAIILLFSSIRSEASTFFVTEIGAGLMDGTSWDNAAPGTDLQTIIDDALNGDEVWVACGIYTPTAGTDRSISFSMRNELAIYGSFQGTENSLNERDLSCGPCSILSGEIGGSGNADNSYTVVSNAMLDNTAELDGFTISDGNDDRSPTSNGNGLVTTATVRIPFSRASSAIIGAAPVPVPPPIPAVMKIISDPSIAASILSRSSTAA